MNEMIDWNKLTIEQYIEHLENKFRVDSSGTAKAVFELINAYKALHIGGVRLSFTDEKFRELFNELIRAGRYMQTRDNLGNSYMSEEMYFNDVKDRYSNEA